MIWYRHFPEPVDLIWFPIVVFLQLVFHGGPRVFCQR
jgi:hypothetical protein